MRLPGGGMSGRKIAAATVQNRTQTPFWNWLRNKLLAVERLPTTPNPGLATESGKCEYQNPLRFPNTQSTRSPDAPALPGGVHHKLADNYYLGRDGRHSVNPPAPLYKASVAGVAYGTQTGEALAKDQAVSVGPAGNFGLEAPTPGFGAEWTRNRERELISQKEDPKLAYVERFDRYARSQ